jgi:hypothetical protein
MPLEPEAEKLFRSAMRQRLTRAGLLKIIRENEKREELKSQKNKEDNGTSIKDD